MQDGQAMSFHLADDFCAGSFFGDAVVCEYLLLRFGGPSAVTAHSRDDEGLGTFVDQAAGDGCDYAVDVGDSS